MKRTRACHPKKGGPRPETRWVGGGGGGVGGNQFPDPPGEEAHPGYEGVSFAAKKPGLTLLEWQEEKPGGGWPQEVRQNTTIPSLREYLLYPAFQGVRESGQPGSLGREITSRKMLRCTSAKAPLLAGNKKGNIR